MTKKNENTAENAEVEKCVQVETKVKVETGTETQECVQVETNDNKEEISVIETPKEEIATDADTSTDFLYYPRVLRNRLAKNNKSFLGFVLHSYVIGVVLGNVGSAIVTKTPDNIQTDKASEVMMELEQDLKILQVVDKLGDFNDYASKLIDKTIQNTDISEAQAQSIAQRFTDDFVPLEDIGKIFNVVDYGDLRECRQEAVDRTSNTTTGQINVDTEYCLDGKSDDKMLSIAMFAVPIYTFFYYFSVIDSRKIDSWAEEKLARRRKKDNTASF